MKEDVVYGHHKNSGFKAPVPRIVTVAYDQLRNMKTLYLSINPNIPVLP
jgi:hypothetical protein